MISRSQERGRERDLKRGIAGSGSLGDKSTAAAFVFVASTLPQLLNLRQAPRSENGPDSFLVSATGPALPRPSPYLPLLKFEKGEGGGGAGGRGGPPIHIHQQV